MKKLRIGYFADGPWSHQAFLKIQENKDIEIAFIIPRFDTKDTVLEDYAKANNIDYFKLKNVNDTESIEKLEAYKCDLYVSMSFNQIFRKEILASVDKGIINCHAGKLPFYRGRNILNWALINDEKEFGITVHFVDEGIDTGDIILQRTFPISEEDTYNTLLEVAYKECANILYDTLILFLDNRVKRISQNDINPLGMYCGRRGEGDEVIDWNQDSRNIFNFIRALCDPGPKATTYLDGQKVTINKVEFYSEAPSYIGKPGQILARAEDGFLVKTKDSYIRITELISKLPLRIGRVLNNKSNNE